MTEIAASIVFVCVFLVHICWFKRIPRCAWWFAVVCAVVTDVPWMSHLWHILYGEDRIGTCDERHETAVFGWTPCFVSEWNTYVNTYEITLVVEFLVLTSITYAVIPAFASIVNASHTAAILAYTMNTINLVFVIMLFFASPLFLDGFKNVFTVTGFVCSLMLAGLFEYLAHARRNVRSLPL